MARTKGARDLDYDKKRRALVHKIASQLASRTLVRPSMRQIAAGADISVSTLQHYFGNRTLLMEAVFDEYHRIGLVHLERAKIPKGDLAESIEDFVRSFQRGLMAGGETRLIDLMAVSFGEGFLDPELSTAVFRRMINPAVEALMARMDQHIAAGHMAPTNTRTAAMLLVTPVLAAAFHREHYCDDRFDAEDFTRTLIRNWVLAYQASDNPKPQQGSPPVARSATACVVVDAEST